MGHLCPFVLMENAPHTRKAPFLAPKVYLAVDRCLLAKIENLIVNGCLYMFSGAVKTYLRTYMRCMKSIRSQLFWAIGQSTMVR